MCGDTFHKIKKGVANTAATQLNATQLNFVPLLAEIVFNVYQYSRSNLIKLYQQIVLFCVGLYPGTGYPGTRVGIRNWFPA